MLVNKIDFNKYYYFGIRNSFGDYTFEILSYNMQFDYIMLLISSKKDLDGENGVNSILNGIKNVKVTEEEFEIRKKHDDEIRANDFKDYDWDFENNPLYFHIIDLPENYGLDKLATIYYLWSSESGFAYSYKDITTVTDLSGKYEEYYSTPEVIEVLEKWKEALERWNNLEERKKMIEEYERENTKS